jgi:ribose-phosphate pyrophosphokinase
VRSVSVVPELAAAVRRAVGEGTCTVVAPDHGARHRADLMAAALGQRSEASWIQKFRHPATGRVTAQGIVGPVPGGTAVIVDDILDTGKTVDLAVRLLRRRGFDRLFLVITHALMSGDAPARMRRLRFEKIVAADTVPLRKEAARLPGMTVVKVGRRLADAVLQAA